MAEVRERPGGLLHLASGLSLDFFEEVCMRCSVDDILRMRQTCRMLKDLIDNSKRLWLQRLHADYGLELKMHKLHDSGMMQFAKTVYEADSASSIRFQGTYTNGGVDTDPGLYWVDNLFKRDDSLYCSNVSANADCIGLLLDGFVDREVSYRGVRKYLERRCGAAATEMARRDGRNDIPSMADLSDRELEAFFLGLLRALEANLADGRLLLSGVTLENQMEEVRQMVHAAHFISRRPALIRADLCGDADNKDVLFDASTLPKLESPLIPRKLGIVDKLELLRMGPLTCPVRTLAVLIGTIDLRLLSGKDKDAAWKALQDSVAEASRLYPLDGVTEVAQLEAAVEAGHLPPVSLATVEVAGVVYQFGTGAPPGAAQVGEASPLTTWRPVLWAQFHGPQEAQAFYDANLAPIEASGTAQIIRVKEGPHMATSAPPAEGHLAHLGQALRDRMQQPWREAGLLEAAIGDEADAVAAQPSRTAQPGSQRDGAAEQATPLVSRPTRRGDGAPHPAEARTPGVQEAGDGNGHIRMPGSPLDQSDDDSDSGLEYGMDAWQTAHGSEGEGTTDGPSDSEDLGESDSEDEEVDGMEEEDEGLEGAFVMEGVEQDDTAYRNRIEINLVSPVVGNIILVKLIDQENMMSRYEDEHEWPNIDMTHLGVYGKCITLPSWLAPQY
ncbi:hypothetical protein ACKKBG_A35115 [Auxenochlorella protothecoides x Auxenochlorella symbiontica]